MTWLWKVEEEINRMENVILTVQHKCEKYSKTICSVWWRKGPVWNPSILKAVGSYLPLVSWAIVASSPTPTLSPLFCSYYSILFLSSFLCYYLRIVETEFVQTPFLFFSYSTSISIVMRDNVEHINMQCYVTMLLTLFIYSICPLLTYWTCSKFCDCNLIYLCHCCNDYVSPFFRV